MKKTFATLTLLVAATLFCAGVGFALLATVAILLNPDSWYFPGDPPAADLGLEAAAVGVAGFVIAAVVAAVTGSIRERLVRGVLTVGAATLLAAAAFPSAVMVSRHFGEWAAFRQLALAEVAAAQAAGKASVGLEDGPTFRFSTRATPVRIRAVTTGEWPSVLVDFGAGGNASLDLRTMWCTYSD
jgi:hypothetical protein